MVTPKMKRRIKSELSSEKPTIWIGKNGATERIVDEVSRQLEKREMVKIKILKSALRKEGAKSIASQIVEQSGATLIDVRGHTLILYKRRRGQE